MDVARRNLDAARRGDATTGLCGTGVADNGPNRVIVGRPVPSRTSSARVARARPRALAPGNPWGASDRPDGHSGHEAFQLRLGVSSRRTDEGTRSTRLFRLEWTCRLPPIRRACSRRRICSPHSSSSSDCGWSRRRCRATTSSSTRSAARRRTRDPSDRAVSSGRDSRLFVNNAPGQVLLVTSVPDVDSRHVWLLVFLLAMGQPATLLASDYFGQVTFNGLPGSRRHGDRPTLTARSSRRRRQRPTATASISLADLADGLWTLTIELFGFATITREITVPTKDGSAAGRAERPLVRRAHARAAAGADIRQLLIRSRQPRRARRGADQPHGADRSRGNGRGRRPPDQRQPEQRRVDAVRAAARHRQQPAEASRGLQLRRGIPDGQLGVGRASVLADRLAVGQAVVRRHAGARHVPGTDQGAVAAEPDHAVARLPGRVDDERDHAVHTDADGPGARGRLLADARRARPAGSRSSIRRRGSRSTGA